MNKLTLVVLAAVLIVLACYQLTSPTHAGPGADVGNKPAAAAEQQTRIKTLEDRASDQAHAMVSVAYHFDNLWFAGGHENWPLAQFYWNETRSHLRWAVRIIPVRKDSAGAEIKLTEILDALENTPLAKLQATIDRQDRDAFDAAYKETLEGCYACHKAVEKPYLRLQVPTHPAEPMIQFEPDSSVK